MSLGSALAVREHSCANNSHSISLFLTFTLLPPHPKCFIFYAACATAAGAGRAARPAGRMQDQHVVDRAGTGRSAAGVYQMQPGSKRSRTLSTS